MGARSNKVFSSFFLKSAAKVGRSPALVAVAAEQDLSDPSNPLTLASAAGGQLYLLEASHRATINTNEMWMAGIPDPGWITGLESPNVITQFGAPEQSCLAEVIQVSKQSCFVEAEFLESVSDFRMGQRCSA